jgi:hypothetical protein
MNPADLITPQLIKRLEGAKTIVVAGFTKTGKITISNKLSEVLGYPVIKSDDYKFKDYGKKCLYEFMGAGLAYYNVRKPVIIEGVKAFRLLRKGLQLRCFYPDVIIRTECNEETIKHFYRKDGEAEKIDRVMSFNKGLNTTWEDYLRLLNEPGKIIYKRPKIITLTTTLPKYANTK